MRGRLGQTSAIMARMRKHLATDAPADASEPGRLGDLVGFGSNPGALRMRCYVPAELAPRPALVIVLHGCTQDAEGYDRGAGWSTLADRFGFALLLPEQTRSNNPKTCFNWFQPGDVVRDSGEALSIREGVARMLADHGLDRTRVFVTGLSAGGAMAAAMLAAYPDVFAGGAIIAGLPYGRATNVQEALTAMFQGGAEPARVLGDRVRAASSHRGPWPRVSVWHGSADTTVVPSNAEATVKQWLDVHGLAGVTPRVDLVDGHPRRAWRDPAGHAVVEAFTIEGMAHGTPLAPSAPEGPHGHAGPFFIDAGIASSLHIARFFGITDWRSQVQPSPAPEARRAAPAMPPPAPEYGTEVGAVIARALRSAGLMRD